MLLLGEVDNAGAMNACASDPSWAQRPSARSFLHTLPQAIHHVQPLASGQQFLRHFPAVFGQLLHDFFMEPDIHCG